MENLLIFAITLLSYFSVSYVIKRPANLIRRLAFITILTIPFNFNGHVITLFGNGVGEKGIYSILSLYQASSTSSKGDAWSLFSLYQSSGNNCVSIFGSAIQKCKYSINLFGISLYQEGEGVSAPFCIYQNAKTLADTKIFGIYQKILPGKDRSFPVHSVLELDANDTNDNNIDLSNKIIIGLFIFSMLFLFLIVLRN
jgi:hypothetical protein